MRGRAPGARLGGAIPALRSARLSQEVADGLRQGLWRDVMLLVGHCPEFGVRQDFGEPSQPFTEPRNAASVEQKDRGRDARVTRGWQREVSQQIGVAREHVRVRLHGPEEWLVADRLDEFRRYAHDF